MPTVRRHITTAQMMVNTRAVVYPMLQIRVCVESASDGSMTVGYSTSEAKLPTLLAAYRK